MKKLFLGLAVVAGSMAFAQQFGVKAGGNVAHLSGEGVGDAKAGFGYYAGVFANVPVAQDFSIQPEVLYNSLGYKSFSTELGNTKVTKTNRLDYVSVPVMFQYNFVPNFYLEAGPEFSFLVNAKSKFSGNLLGINIPANSTSIKDDFNTFNFGMGIGAGYNFTKNVGFNVRYTAGLTDITKAEVTKQKVNHFQFGLNFKF